MAEGIRFDWDEANLGHIARHGVSRKETEETILNDPVELSFDHVGDEPRWVVVGRTDRGRFLVVAFTERSAALRAVTAFEATRGDEVVYFARKERS